MRLLVHELAHIVQQSGANTKHSAKIAKSTDNSEVEATMASDAIYRGEPVPRLTLIQTPMINRWEMPSWNSIRNTAYSAIIDSLRSLQRRIITQLRGLASGLTEPLRAPVDAMVTVFDSILEVLIRLSFAIIGLITGFGAGIVEAVVGLLRFIYNIAEGLASALVDLITGSAHLGEWLDRNLDALRQIPSSLRSVVDQWLVEFESASEDRQTIMIGELTGRIIAIIATIEIGGRLIPRLPPVSVTVPTGVSMVLEPVAVGFEAAARPAISVATTTVNITPALAASSTAVMSISSATGALLGEGPETSAMHETGRRGAGMSRSPRHHIFPQEGRLRRWFAERGFTDIDNFCVELDEATHQAIHGGGNWRLGRTWPNEWNSRIMRELESAEASAGRMLTRDEIILVGQQLMDEYEIVKPFVSYR
jgi:hypothetical protein